MTGFRQIAEKIHDADAILVGASNGLSISEGLHLFADNNAFRTLFGGIRQKYGLSCILQCMGARWPTQEEEWAFWAKLIDHYCVSYVPTPVMEDLKAILGNKDFFIITSNGECHFELCGIDPDKIWEIEGEWLHMQCAAACHDTLYPTLEMANQMADVLDGDKIPSELVPRCPKCGGSMRVHLVGPNFISDERAQKRFGEFLRRYSGQRLVVLELGIGPRNRLIKAPLMNLVAQEPHATYVTINLGEVYVDARIADKSFGLDGSLSEMLSGIRKACDAIGQEVNG